METFSALLAICAGNSPVPLSRPLWRHRNGIALSSLNKELQENLSELHVNVTWIAQDMETLSTWLSVCMRNLLVTVDYRHKMRNFDICFGESILNKYTSCQWFETLKRLYLSGLYESFVEYLLVFLHWYGNNRANLGVIQYWRHWNILKAWNQTYDVVYMNIYMHIYIYILQTDVDLFNEMAELIAVTFMEWLKPEICIKLNV